jgi:hypothetical protein
MHCVVAYVNVVLRPNAPGCDSNVLLDWFGDRSVQQKATRQGICPDTLVYPSVWLAESRSCNVYRRLPRLAAASSVIEFAMSRKRRSEVFFSNKPSDGSVLTDCFVNVHSNLRLAVKPCKAAAILRWENHSKGAWIADPRIPPH